MSKENATGVVKTIVNGVVSVARAGAVGLLGYEFITKILGGTSIIGTIVRTQSAKHILKSMRENIPEEHWTEDTAKDFKDRMEFNVESVE